MSAPLAAWLLTAAALLLVPACPPAALVLAMGAGACALLAPSPERRDARRRNQAHPNGGRR